MSKYRMQTSLYILFPLIIIFNTSANSTVGFCLRPYMNAVVSNGGIGQMTEVGFNAQGSDNINYIRIELGAFEATTAFMLEYE